MTTAIVLALHFLAFFLLLGTLWMSLVGVPAGMLLSA